MLECVSDRAHSQHLSPRSWVCDFQRGHCCKAVPPTNRYPHKQPDTSAGKSCTPLCLHTSTACTQALMASASHSWITTVMHAPVHARHQCHPVPAHFQVTQLSPVMQCAACWYAASQAPAAHAMQQWEARHPLHCHHQGFQAAAAKADHLQRCCQAPRCQHWQQQQLRRLLSACAAAPASLGWLPA